MLSRFSETIEKLFVTSLDDFIEKKFILMDTQYGFRSGTSTSMTLIEMVEEITNCIDDKKYAYRIFVDLRKAFDTIDHEILIEKLERYGIRCSRQVWYGV